MTGVPRSTRRWVIAGVLAGLAGCLGDEDDDGRPEAPDRRGPTIGDRELSGTFPLILEDLETGEKAADVHYHDDGGTHWHRMPLTVPLDDPRVFRVLILDDDEEKLDLGGENGYELAFLPDEENEMILDGEVEGDELTLWGREEGRARPRLELVGPDGDRWETPQMLIDVEPPE